MMAWEPVNFIALADGLEIHVDEIAMTIGKGNTALATYAWPEDGNTYALCRQVPDGDAELAKWRDYEETIAELRRQLRKAQQAITEVKAASAAGEWMPVVGPVIIELAPGTMVIFRADSAESLGATEDYPNGYRLCEYIGSQEGRDGE